MKEDAPPPKHPPKKRYQLQKVPDLWLAIWASDSDLSEEEIARVQEERQHRKAARPDKIIGVLVDPEDVTPPQLQELKSRLISARPTEIHHPWTTHRIAGAVRTAARSVNATNEWHKSLREVVVLSTMVIAAPRGQEDVRNRTPAWDAVQYAKHRKLPVTVVLPDGTVKGEV